MLVSAVLNEVYRVIGPQAAFCGRYGIIIHSNSNNLYIIIHFENNVLNESLVTDFYRLNCFPYEDI